MIDLMDIAPAFSFIIEKGLELSAATYDPQAFGNASLTMAGPPFALRLDRDRGQIFCDIGGDAVGWYKLEYVLEFVDRSIDQKQLGEPPDASLLASLLRERWDTVARIFSDQEKMLQLNAFVERKTEKFLAKIFGKH